MNYKGKTWHLAVLGVGLVRSGPHWQPTALHCASQSGKHVISNILLCSEPPQSSRLPPLHFWYALHTNTHLSVNKLTYCFIMQTHSLCTRSHSLIGCKKCSVAMETYVLYGPLLNYSATISELFEVLSQFRGEV